MKLLPVLFLLVLIGINPAVADDVLDQRSTFVSTFSVGDNVEDVPNHFKIRELGNILTSGKDRYFMTFAQLLPVIGKHSFEIVMSDKNRKVIKQIRHGDLTISRSDHVHSLYSVWDMDLFAKDFVYIDIVDNFNGLRQTVATFKLIVK